MLGTIAGDVIGSIYEVARIKHTDFPLFSAKSRFTDDSVLTIAFAARERQRNAPIGYLDLKRYHARFH